MFGFGHNFFCLWTDFVLFFLKRNGLFQLWSHLHQSGSNDGIPGKIPNCDLSKITLTPKKSWFKSPLQIYFYCFVVLEATDIYRVKLQMNLLRFMWYSLQTDRRTASGGLVGHIRVVLTLFVYGKFKTCFIFGLAWLQTTYVGTYWLWLWLCFFLSFSFTFWDRFDFHVKYFERYESPEKLS